MGLFGASEILHFEVPHSVRTLRAEARNLETGLRPNIAGIPYTLLLRVGAIGFPTFGLLL